MYDEDTYDGMKLEDSSKVEARRAKSQETQRGKGQLI
jgi:hypothetical protein